MRKKISARAPGCAFIAWMWCAIATTCAMAQSLPANPPLPPPRPAFPGEAAREGADQPQARDDARTAPRTSEQPVPAQNGATPPWIWPPTDRAALRACAIEWQRLKESGASGVMTWRTFGPECVARSKAPDR